MEFDTVDSKLADCGCKYTMVLLRADTYARALDTTMSSSAA